jgi:hypothetical protein
MQRMTFGFYLIFCLLLTSALILTLADFAISAAFMGVWQGVAIDSLKYH